MKYLRGVRWLALGVIIAVGACSSDSTDPNGGNNGGNPTITLTLSASALSIVQGASGTLNATIGRAGGFTGAVTIEVTGAPTGMTATPAPATVGSGATSSTITVAPGASLTPGAYTLTVRASGTGVSAVTATFQVTVTAAITGGFTLSVTPTTASIQQGAQTTATVNITRTGGFTGSVDLAVSGGPGAGLTAAFNPASTTGNTSTLTLSAAGTLAAATYNLTITGTASGITQQAATFALTVTATTGGGGGNTVWSFCSDEVPGWFAYQDGTGAWTQVQPVNSTFTFPINSGKGGVAYMQDGTNLAILYGTQQELNGYGVQCGESMSTEPTKTVAGSVAGLQPTDNAYITLGGGTAIVSGLASPNFTLTGVRDGTFDLVASRSSVVISGQNVSTQLIGLIFRRALNPADGSTLPVLDFGSTEAVSPVTSNLTVNNIGTDMALVNVFYITANLGFASLYFESNQSASATRPYYGVPNASRVSGDLHVLNVLSLTTSATNYRSASIYFAEATDRTVTLGPQISGLTVSTVNSAPYARLRAQYTVQPEYDDLIIFAGGQQNSTFTIFASKAYVGASATYDFAIPDFTGVGGWVNSWAPQLGINTDWSFSATGYSMPGGLLTPFADGLLSQNAVTTGSITP
ncbi:MAG TPA: hypothetical protein VMM79_06215 [Longimicrobiales bacterium]|nr:hypothetical protein [Longimicrobiales bacterium]